MKAVEIISVNHSTQVHFNLPVDNFVGNLGGSEFSIYIEKCCVSVVDNLKDAGYKLSMYQGYLHVDKY